MRYDHLEPHAQELFERWYQRQMRNRIRFWITLCCVCFYVIDFYLFWAIVHANGWYSGALKETPFPWWMFFVAAIGFIAPLFLGGLVGQIVAHKVSRTKLESAFNETFSVVFDTFEELEACTDVKRKFFGVTREQREIMYEELMRRINSIPDMSLRHI
jgi:hypothetical protein